MPEPFDPDEFVANLGTVRNRPIDYCTVPFPKGSNTSGFSWIEKDFDCIVVSAVLSKFEHNLTLFHELTHIICEHKPRFQDDTVMAEVIATLEVLADSQAPRRVATGLPYMLQSHNYLLPDEAETELLATELSIASRAESRSKTTGTVARAFGRLR